MKVIEAELCHCSDPEYYSIWINTWQFSLLCTPQQAIINMITSMIDQIGKLQPNNSNYVNLKKKLIRFSVWFGKRLYDTADRVFLDGKLNQCGFGSEDLYKGVNCINSGESAKINDDANNDMLTVVQLNQEIRTLITDILSGKKDDTSSSCDKQCDSTQLSEDKVGNIKGFIFFIDDLDRIDPKLAVDILDLSKNIFDFEACVFVLAIDYSVVVRGLEPKFGKLDSHNEYEFRRYFDKLIQLSYALPVSFYNLRGFFKKHFDDISLFDFDALSNEGQNALLNDLTQIAYRTVGSNPRSLKRLVNTVSLMDALRRAYLVRFGRKENIPGQLPAANKVMAFIFACMQLVYPKVFNFILEHRNFTDWTVQLGDSCYLPKVTAKQLMAAGLNKSEQWKVVLFRICQQDLFLQRNFNNILYLMEEIDDRYMHDKKVLSQDMGFMLPWITVIAADK